MDFSETRRYTQFPMIRNRDELEARGEGEGRFLGYRCSVGGSFFAVDSAWAMCRWGPKEGRRGEERKIEALLRLARPFVRGLGGERGH